MERGFNSLPDSFKETVIEIATEVLVIPDAELSDRAVAIDTMALTDPYAEYESSYKGSLLTRYYEVLAHLTNIGDDPATIDAKTSLALRGSIASRLSAITLDGKLNSFPDYAKPRGVERDIAYAQISCREAAVFMATNLFN